MSRLRIITEFLTGSVDKGVQKVRTKIREMTNDVSKSLAGAFAIGSIISGIKGLLDQAERLADIGAKFKVLPKEIQTLENVASVTGASVTGLNGVLNASYRRAQEAANGNKTYRESFERLGVSVENIKNMNAVEIFYAMADGVKNSEDRMQSFADVFNVAGEQGREFFAMLEMGSAEIQRVGESMGTMSNRTAQSLAKINTDFRSTWTFVKSVGANTLAFLLSVGQTVFSTIAGFAYSLWDTYRGVTNAGVILINTVWDLAKALLRVGNIVKNALKLDFGGAAEEWRQMGKDLGNALNDGISESVQNIKGTVESVKNNFLGAAENIHDIWTEEPKAPKNDPIPFLLGDEDSNTGNSEKDQLAKMRLAVAEKEWELKLKAMKAEERLAELQKARAVFARLANDETEEGLRMKERLLDIEDRIRREREQLDQGPKQNNGDDPATPKLHKNQGQTDLLARIGAGVRVQSTGPENQMVSLAKRQLAAQEQIAKNTAKGGTGISDPVMKA
tara:strand:+ start:33604 stop:35118 length:1515 start_codon:yes stop_codon:yes gene_type:complete